MKRYKDISGRSGVTFYEIDGDSITIRFRDDDYEYVYNAERPGYAHVLAMQQRAQLGRGLAAYINRFVRDDYAEKRPIS